MKPRLGVAALAMSIVACTGRSSSGGLGSGDGGDESTTTRPGTPSGDASNGSSSGEGQKPNDIACDGSDPNLCVCAHTGAGTGSSEICSKGTLANRGVCCAGSNWPSSGTCQCAAFSCTVNGGGGHDCWYRGANDNGSVLTVATGAACCVRGGICSCYSNASACNGFPTVASCTADVTPACKDPLTEDDKEVASCR